MDHAAVDLMNAYKDIQLAFGQSDEYRSVSLSVILDLEISG